MKKFLVPLSAFLISASVLYAATTIGSNITTTGTQIIGAFLPSSDNVTDFLSFMKVSGSADPQYGQYIDVNTSGASAYGLFSQASSTQTFGSPRTYGVYGRALIDPPHVGASYGVYGDAHIVNGGSGTAYGVYGNAISDDTTGATYGAYFSASGSHTTNHGLYAAGTTLDTGVGDDYGGEFYAFSHSGSSYGVKSVASGNPGASVYGVYASANGEPGSTGYSLYADAGTDNGATNYAGWFTNVDTNHSTTTVVIDSPSPSQGACLKLKDRDGSGYTYVTVNNGTLTASATSCQ